MSFRGADLPYHIYNGEFHCGLADIAMRLRASHGQCYDFAHSDAVDGSWLNVRMDRVILLGLTRRERSRR